MDQKTKRKSKRMLTEALIELAYSVESMDNEQNPLTKAQVLAEKIWKFALGTHTIIHKKTGAVMVGPSEPWAVHLILERIEGKVPILAEDGADRATAADKISDLSTARINKITGEVAGDSDAG